MESVLLSILVSLNAGLALLSFGMELTAVVYLTVIIGGLALTASYSLFWNCVVLSVVLLKLGAAGAHRWAVSWLTGVPAVLFVYLTIVPEMALLMFWQNVAWSACVPAGVTLAASLAAAIPHGMRTRGVLAFSSVTSVGLVLAAKPSPAVYQYLWINSASLVALLGAPRAATSYVGLASLAGLPPTAGFFGKAWVFWNATARSSFWLVLLALVSALLSTVYSLRLVRRFS